MSGDGWNNRVAGWIEPGVGIETNDQSLAAHYVLVNLHEHAGFQQRAAQHDHDVQVLGQGIGKKGNNGDVIGAHQLLHDGQSLARLGYIGGRQKW